MEVYVLLFYLLVLSIYDCREKQVPAMFVYIGMAAAAVWLLLQGVNGRKISILILGMLPGMFLLLVAVASKKAGYADGIVLAIVGAISGYKEAVLVFCISLLAVALMSVVLLLLHKVKGRTRIPYLPFLTGAFLVRWVWAI